MKTRKEWKKSHYALKCGDDAEHLIDEIFDDMEKIFYLKVESLRRRGIDRKISIYTLAEKGAFLEYIGGEYIDSSSSIGYVPIAVNAIKNIYPELDQKIRLIELP